MISSDATSLADSGAVALLASPPVVVPRVSPSFQMRSIAKIHPVPFDHVEDVRAGQGRGGEEHFLHSVPRSESSVGKKFLAHGGEALGECSLSAHSSRTWSAGSYQPRAPGTYKKRTQSSPHPGPGREVNDRTPSAPRPDDWDRVAGKKALALVGAWTMVRRRRHLEYLEAGLSFFVSFIFPRYIDTTKQCEC